MLRYFAGERDGRPWMVISWLYAAIDLVMFTVQHSGTQLGCYEAVAVAGGPQQRGQRPSPLQQETLSGREDGLGGRHLWTHLESPSVVMLG